MMVKICGITNEEDAAAVSDAGASAIGFNFYPKSPRCVTPEQAGRLGRNLPPTVWKVGVFVNESSETIERIARVAGLDVAQVLGDATPTGVRLWRACRADRIGEMAIAGAEAVLVDTPSDRLFGGTGETFDWSRARGAAERVILAGGLDASNVAEAIAAARPWGVDACSRLESSPGRKDPVKVREFIKAALNA